jgi:hypothetical protein
MRRLHLAAGAACLALVLALSATVSSCMSSVGIGDACSSTGDCEPTISQPTGAMVSTLCALGRCHYECPSSSFCGTGSSCVHVGSSDVCTLPDESVCPCPAGLQCGPDKLCHTSCTSPGLCLPFTQTCIMEACIDNAVPDGGPDASPIEAGSDAADTGGPGDSSSRDSAAPPSDTGGAEAGDSSRSDGSPAEASPADANPPKDAPGE